MKQFLIMVALIGLSFSVSMAGEQGSLKDQTAKESYSLGYQFGSNLKMQEIAVDKEILLQAVRDALDEKQPQLSPEEIRETMFQLRRKAMVQQDKRIREMAAKNRELGNAFLEANKKKEGVVTLPSGLQFKVLREGDGPKPGVHDIVKVNYRGTLITGAEFDSTYNARGPAVIKTDDVIKGWTEALQLMKAGSKWQIFVPADLAYGDRQFSRIPPGSTLIFDIELLSLEDPSALITGSQDNAATGSESGTIK